MIVLVCALLSTLTPATALRPAEAYLQLGEDELSARHWKTAAIALERAVKLAPKLRRAWESLGIAYARLGKLAKSARALRQAISGARARPRALLELAKVHFWRREPKTARKVIARLRKLKPRGSIATAARFWDALSALRLGERAVALEELKLLSRSPGPFAQPAEKIIKSIRSRPRLAVSWTLSGEFDSNALLLPAAPVALQLPDPESDIAAVLTGGVRGRPFRSIDLMIRADVLYREQRSVDELDMLGALGGLVYRGRWGRHAVETLYRFGYYRLNGAPYLLSNELLARYRLRLGPSLQLVSSGGFTVRRFQNGLYDAFSGEGGTVGFAVRLGSLARSWRVDLGYLFTVEVTQERDLGYHSHQAGVSVRWWPHPRVSLGLSAALEGRLYLAADEVLTETRTELQPTVAGSIIARLASTWRLALSMSYTHNDASPSFYAYDRFRVSLASILDIPLL